MPFPVLIQKECSVAPELGDLPFSGNWSSAGRRPTCSMPESRSFARLSTNRYLCSEASRFGDHIGVCRCMPMHQRIHFPLFNYVFPHDCVKFGQKRVITSVPFPPIVCIRADYLWIMIMRTSSSQKIMLQIIHCYPRPNKARVPFYESQPTALFWFQCAIFSLLVLGLSVAASS